MMVPGLPGKPTQQFSGQDVSGDRSRSGPGGMPLSHRQKEPGHPGNSGAQVAARATCVGPSCVNQSLDMGHPAKARNLDKESLCS